jgi:hypothetical protein
MNNTGLDLIAKARQKQIDKGYTPELDLDYYQEELAIAAMCYIKAGIATNYSIACITYDGGYRKGEGTPQEWPWASEYWTPSNEAVENYAKAGALIAAELDRLMFKINE